MTKKMTALIMAMSLAAAAAAGCKSSESGTASTAADSGSSAADESATGGSLSAEGDTQGTDHSGWFHLRSAGDFRKGWGIILFYAQRCAGRTWAFGGRPERRFYGGSGSYFPDGER